MKVKIKGLVFVGFAAAILSANAMAAPAAASDVNTVTSKAYTEATYQKKATENYKVSKSDGTWNDLATTVTADGENAVTAAGIAAYVSDALDDKIASGTYVAANYDENTDVTTLDLDNDMMTTTYTNGTLLSQSSSNLVTEAVVAKAIADSAGTDANTYQEKSTASYQIGGANGTWETLSNGTNTTVSRDTTNPENPLIKINVAEMGAAAAGTAGTVGLVPASAAGDQDKVLTAGKTWILKQNEQTEDKYQVSKNKQWVNASGIVTEGAHIDATPASDGSVEIAVTDITNAGTDIVANDTGLTTGKAVYEYIAAQPSNGIPAADPLKCNDTTPCSLVAETDGFHWRVMATGAANQSPAAGTLGDLTSGSGPVHGSDPDQYNG